MGLLGIKSKICLKIIFDSIKINLIADAYLDPQCPNRFGIFAVV